MRRPALDGESKGVRGRVKRRYCGNTEWIRRREGGWRRPGRQDKKSLPGIFLAGT